MTERIKEFALLAAVLVVVFFIYEWHTEHDNATKLQAQMGAQQTIVQNSEEAIKQRDAQLALTLAQMQSLIAAVRTPAQAATAIPTAINSSLPQPITINVPQPTAANPTPAAIATIPQGDLKPLYDQIIE